MLNLNKREKLLLQILIAVIIVTLVYYLIILPLVGFVQDAEGDTMTRTVGIFVDTVPAGGCGGK